MIEQCICRGMNQDCIKCGGNGYIDKEEKVEVIKLKVTKEQLEEESKELKAYKKGKEKMYVSDRKGGLTKSFLKKLKNKRVQFKR